MTRAKPKPPVRPCATWPNLPCLCRSGLSGGKSTCTRRREADRAAGPRSPGPAAHTLTACRCRSCNPPAADTRTWWRGVENPARKVEGRFGTMWRPLVEVVWMGQRPIYLDDAEGKGWRKVTEGKASPQWAHAELIPQEVRDRG